MAVVKLKDGTLSDAYGKPRAKGVKYTAAGMLDFSSLAHLDLSEAGKAAVAAIPAPTPMPDFSHLDAQLQGLFAPPALPPLDPVTAALVPPPAPPPDATPAPPIAPLAATAPPGSQVKRLLPFVPVVLGVAAFPVVGLLAPVVGGAASALWVFLRETHGGHIGP